MGQLKEVLINAEDAVRQTGKFISSSPLVMLDGYVDGLWYDTSSQRFYLSYVVELTGRRARSEVHRFQINGEQVSVVDSIPSGLFELSDQIPSIMEVLNEEGA